MEDPNWKYDVVPEIMDGKNIADYIDADNLKKLEELELEEEMLQEARKDIIEDEEEEAKIRYHEKDNAIVLGGRLIALHPVQ